MKQQVLQYLQMGSLAINIMILFLLLVSCKSSNVEIDNDVQYNNLYYEVINSVILETKITDRQNNVLNSYIKSKKFSEKEVEDYIDKINEINHNLFYKQDNTRLQSYLRDNIANGGDLLDYFGESAIKEATDSVVIGKEFLKSLLKPGINLIQAGFGHTFSSPTIIDNKMVIYHLKSTSANNAISEVLVYEIVKNKIFLKKKFYFTIS